jgi:hypothetical protein
MLTVRIEINRPAAILAGRAWEGSHELQLDDTDLACFALEERELLACVPSGLPGKQTWGSWHGQTAFFSVVEPTFTAFAGALRKHLAELQERAQNAEVQAMQAKADRLAREKKDAARVKLGVEHVKTLTVEDRLAAFRHVSGYGGAVFELKELRDPAGDIFTLPEAAIAVELADLRALRDSREALAKAQKATLEAERRAKLREVIRAYGTPLQLARWNEGFCHEAEALKLQKGVIFRPFDDLPRYARIEHAEVEHTTECVEPDYQSSVSAVKALTDAQYLKLTQVRARAGEGFTWTAREHTVWCGADGCEDSPVISRFGLLLETTWEGHAFSREFALDTE